MEKITGHRASGQGLRGFIEHSRVVSWWSVEDQRTFGARLLRRIVPAPFARLFREMLGLLADSWPTAHLWAVRFGTDNIGAVCSDWLVGDSRLLTAEEETALVQQLREEDTNANPGAVMAIRQCKFMEEASGCKNLCLNLCKAGTEEFFTNELGLPVRMVPNLEDNSCHILLLERPVPPEEDPVFRQPCGARECDERFSMPAAQQMRACP